MIGCLDPADLDDQYAEYHYYSIALYSLALRYEAEKKEDGPEVAVRKPNLVGLQCSVVPAMAGDVEVTLFVSFEISFVFLMAVARSPLPSQALQSPLRARWSSRST